MRKVLVLLAGVTLLVAGCGGGGGGGGGSSAIVLSGHVKNIGTDAAPNPPVTVTAGGVSAGTDAGGAFSLTVPSGTASLLITQTSGPQFTYTFLPITATKDEGTFYVGSVSVSVTGKTVDAGSSAALGGVAVKLQRSAGSQPETMQGFAMTSQSDGTFTLSSVPWDAAASSHGWQADFQKSGYVTQDVPLPSTTSNINLGQVKMLAGVDVSGTFIESSTGNPVAGFIVVFQDAAGNEVGRITTGSNGMFQGVVGNTATKLYVAQAPTGYSGVWTYNAATYRINQPASCFVTIAPPIEGEDFGVFLVYATTSPPPPPPDC